MLNVTKKLQYRRKKVQLCLVGWENAMRSLQNRAFSGFTVMVDGGSEIVKKHYIQWC